MSRISLMSLALVLTALFVASADAQRKTPKKKTTTPKASTAAKTPPTIVPPLDVRAAREKVDAQLSNVGGYLDKLGPVAVGLELAIADQKANKLSPKASQSIDAAREKLVTSLRDLKTGLSQLESEFRTKPALQKYLPSIQGITDLASQSEDNAIAGRFVASKDPLKQVWQKLIDTLGTLPR